MRAASIAFINGPIFTADAADTVATAAYAEDGVIRAVGSPEDIRPLITPETEVFDIAGQTLVPGFIDAHCHPTMLGSALAQIDARYPAVATTADLVAAVAARVATAAPGEWVRGWGLDQDKFHGDPPARWDLDAVSPENPVWILHISGHNALVNSAALRVAGIADDVEDPPGGRFVRDAAGRPTGMLLDSTQQMVMRSPVDVGHHGPSTGIDDAPVEEVVGDVRRAYEAFVKAGITSAVDAQVTARELRGYIEARRQGRLAVRTTCMMLSNHLAEFEALGLAGSLGDDRLALGPMKFYSDGALSGSTASFNEPYLHEEGFHGVTYWSPEELTSLIGRAHALGLQVGIHAQGDAGIGVALDAIEAALIDHPRADHRHRIEHYGAPTDAQIARAARLGILPVSNPRFVYEVGDTFFANLGEDRARRIYPLGRELRAGIPIVAGSDSPVASYEPLHLLWAATTRRTLAGRELTPDDRLTIQQALRAQTINAAYSFFAETRRGSIEPGKLADFALIDGPIVGADTESLAEREVALTVIGGEVAWRRD